MLARLIALVLACALAVPALAQTAAAPDRAAIEQIVREYLMQNPEVLLEAMNELRRRQEMAAAETAKQAIVAHRQELFDDPATPVGGNARGDVTIVEFFDYHCGYCKQAQESVVKLLDEDRNVRFVFKELPILIPESRLAAAAALAAAKQGKYVGLHNALMEARGKLTRDRILALAREQALDLARLEKDMESAEIQQAIDRNLELATAMGVDGTPAFVVGDQLVPGALDVGQLRELVAQARKK
ncbi:MAG: DsbA family protein [Reyranellaceae bacterium]